MDRRPATSPDELRHMGTAELRARFLVEDLFAGEGVRLVYADEERMVLGGAVPGAGTLDLPVPDELRADTFLARRELGVVNVGDGPGSVTVDGTTHELDVKECLYVGRGAGQVSFAGPQARFYLVSTTAHASHPTTRAGLADAETSSLGSQEGSNERTIRKYIHAGGIRSCQLVLGVTTLAPGSMWNTMPCHTHARRTEAYLYFDLPAEHRIVHLMGRPDETRNMIMADRQAVISPRWSVHTGFGTRSYSFVWAMGGENQAFDDMDQVAIPDLR